MSETEIVFSIKSVDIIFICQKPFKLNERSLVPDQKVVDSAIVPIVRPVVHVYSPFEIQTDTCNYDV